MSPPITNASSIPASAIVARTLSRWCRSRIIRAARCTVTSCPSARRRVPVSIVLSIPCDGEDVTVSRTGSGSLAASSSARRERQNLEAVAHGCGEMSGVP